MQAVKVRTSLSVSPLRLGSDVQPGVADHRRSRRTEETSRDSHPQPGPGRHREVWRGRAQRTLPFLTSINDLNWFTLTCRLSKRYQTSSSVFGSCAACKQYEEDALFMVCVSSRTPKFTSRRPWTSIRSTTPWSCLPSTTTPASWQHSTRSVICSCRAVGGVRVEPETRLSDSNAVCLFSGVRPIHQQQRRHQDGSVVQQVSRAAGQILRFSTEEEVGVSHTDMREHQSPASLDPTDS